MCPRCPTLVQAPYFWFVTVTVTCSLGAIAAFVGVVWYAKRKRLM